MNRYCLLSALIAAVAITACATVEQQSTAQDKSDKSYVTGSRIPVRDQSGSGDVKSVESRQNIEDMMRNSGTAAPKAGGM